MVITASFSHIEKILDVLKFRDSWYGCQNLLNNMLSTSTYVQEVSSTSCNSLPGNRLIWAFEIDWIKGTSEYLNDPCCYYLLGWNITCVPRKINVTVAVNEVNQDLVNAQCSNADCVTSFLQVPLSIYGNSKIKGLLSLGFQYRSLRCISARFGDLPFSTSTTFSLLQKSSFFSQ